MNKKLSKADDIKHYEISFEDYMPAMRNFEDDSVIHMPYLENDTYSKAYKEYLNIVNYGKKFRRIEGPIYAFLFISSFLLSLI